MTTDSRIPGGSMSKRATHEGGDGVTTADCENKRLVGEAGILKALGLIPKGVPGVMHTDGVAFADGGGALRICDQIENFETGGCGEEVLIRGRGALSAGK
jgi:hypothetical protein